MSKNILFISAELFKQRTGASNAIDDKQLFPMIKVASDMNIQPTLGSTLYNRLLAGINADNLNVYETALINDYITDCVIWYTMSMLPIGMGYQLFSKGFLQKTAEESNAPSRSDLELIAANYLSMAEFYKTRLIKYLQQNYILFYEYYNNSGALDVIFPERKGYSCPIYLGNSTPPNVFGLVSSYGGGVGVSQMAYYTAVGGEHTFNVTALSSRTTIMATRSGLVKTITTSPTSDTGFIQINNALVTLPTGDVAVAGELFTFLYQ